MDDYIEKCPKPLRIRVNEFDTRVRVTCPDAIVTHSSGTDLEGWIDYALPSGATAGGVFAGVRFRREKPTVTVALATKPRSDAMEWVHPNLGKVRRLPFALGLPRPFRNDVNEDEWKYVMDLVRQAYEDVRSR